MTAAAQDWPAIARKLERETKDALIDLIHELTAVSPAAQRFLHTRYASAATAAQAITAYRRVIQDQFTVSDWNNTISWDFDGVQQVIDEYQQSSRDNAAGSGELLVTALETAVSFAAQFSLQDHDFDDGLTDLSERCLVYLQNHPQMLSAVARRLQKVQREAEGAGYYTVGEHLDELWADNR